MPKPSFRAAAEGLPTRRQFFGKFAAVGAAIGTIRLGSISAREPDIATLIAEHRTASDAWSEAIERVERGQATQDAADLADQRERAAELALLKWRPSTMEANTVRLQYLLSNGGPWHGIVPGEIELDLLFASMGADYAS